MLILTDQDVHQKGDFIGLDKVYKVEFILGINSDTYDILGLIKAKTNFKEELVLEETIKIELEKLILEDRQYFPPYSSRKVKGVPMWKLSREGKESKVLRNIKVYNLKYLDYKDISTQVFQKIYISKIREVKGDFRQEEINNLWQEYFKNDNRSFYRIYQAEFSVSSGTYIRSLINLLGERLKCGAICLRIERIQLGKVKESNL